MRHNGPVWLALALIVLLGGGPADEKKVDKEAAIKKEWERLNGTWQGVRPVPEGKKPPAPREKVSVTLKDGKFTFKRGGEVVAEGATEIDPTATPKSIDVKIATGLEKGEALRGIYVVKGDTLRLCFAGPGQPRPKAFEPAKGSGHDLLTYKRVKTKD
jgi:uncharacterized protein (TIGR03067 family)